MTDQASPAGPDGTAESPSLLDLPSLLEAPELVSSGPDGSDGVGGVLLVHAHPDDETISTGATMAALVAAGVPVTLVTCTRGELGEVIGDDLAHLEGDGDALAAHREVELAAAMRELGVRDHRFLGARQGRRYRDSGMVWVSDGVAGVPPDVSADAFAVAELARVAGDLADVVVEVRPSVVITYEPGGGYGHPDHVRASEVAAEAVRRSASEARLLWVVVPRSVDAAGRARLGARGLQIRGADSEPPVVVDDSMVRYRVDGPAAAKAAALRAHATQVIVSEDEQAFALSNLVWQPLSGTEYLTDATSQPERREQTVPSRR